MAVTHRRPLGWIKQSRSLSDPRPLALVPVAALILALAATAILLTGKRDTGTGIIVDRASADSRLTLLGSPLGP